MLPNHARYQLRYTRIFGFCKTRGPADSVRRPFPLEKTVKSLYRILCHLTIGDFLYNLYLYVIFNSQEAFYEPYR